MVAAPNPTFAPSLSPNLPVQSVWSPVLYTNSLAMVPTGIIGLVSGDFANVPSIEWTLAGVCVLLLSCVVGMGISFAGFKCQQVIGRPSVGRR